MSDQQSGWRKAYFSRRWLLLSCYAIFIALAGCRGVPQVLDDEAVQGELDALFTAVTSKRRELLTASRQRFEKLHTERRLSDAGFTEISAIIKQAEDDKWQPAAERLHDFIRAQHKSQ